MMSFDASDEPIPQGPPPLPPHDEPIAASAAASRQMNVTEEEKLWAMLAQLLTIVTAVIGPLVVYVIYMNRSKYVAFHALQAVFFVVAITVLSFAVGILVFVSLILCPVAFILIPPGLLLSLAALVWPIYAAVQAYNGVWYEYPVIGPWARQMVYGS